VVEGGSYIIHHDALFQRNVVGKKVLENDEERRGSDDCCSSDDGVKLDMMSSCLSDGHKKVDEMKDEMLVAERLYCLMFGEIMCCYEKLIHKMSVRRCDTM